MQASGSCEEVHERQLAQVTPHHHQQQQHAHHHQISNSAFHISRSSHPISTIISPPPSQVIETTCPTESRIETKKKSVSSPFSVR